MAAAARSDVGRDLVTVSSAAAEAVAGQPVGLRVSGRRVAEVTVTGPCLTGPVTATGPGEVRVTVRETTLPGPCPLTATTRRTGGTTEIDAVGLRIVPDAQGVIFRDGFVETRLDFRALATSTAFGGVQVRTARPGDAYTQSGYLVYLRPNGSVDVHRAGTGVIATGTGAAVTGPTTLRVELRGPELRVFVGGEAGPRVAVTDPSPIAGPGHVQLVTGRAAVDFDDVRVGGLAVTS
ncbi:DUF1080 domain-containing protein [Actinomadura sp. ATCC 31491]|uniref:DUF1080 domain-containing protein n=1 Tax=Actinomadura luzonensis TaxID=2805427 RepID=A0ABT0GBV7_9ACTN|nr:DUF1080 domain-containing protein [Actinomadura luzonensis]MCK2221883.1 DUF1080 domain-containing protein [Actinomadura luzonensis]